MKIVKKAMKNAIAKWGNGEITNEFPNGFEFITIDLSVPTLRVTYKVITKDTSISTFVDNAERNRWAIDEFVNLFG